MKKRYINPATMIVNVKTAPTMLTGSTENLQISNGTATEWGSRRNTIWDDEDEDY